MARIASIKLTFKRGRMKEKFYFCLVYAPDINYEKEFPYEEFLENLTDVVNACLKDHILILGIDANCKLGRSDGSSQNDDGEKSYSSIGKFNLPQTNEPGIAFKKILQINELCATNTFFKKKQYASKFFNLQNEFYTTDFIITKQKDKN